MATTQKRRPGRPTKYTDQTAKQAEKLCKLGATDVELADFFEVHLDTIKEWKTVHPEFSAALTRGKETPDEMVERKLFERATGYSHPAVKIMQYEGSPIIVPYTEHYPPDPASCIFWLKNRRRDKWQDRPQGDSTEAIQELAAALRENVRRADAEEAVPAPASS